MKLGKFALVAVSLIAAVFISGCIGQGTPTTTTTTQQAVDGYYTYESQLYGVRMKYPAEWAKAENYMSTIAYFSSGSSGTEDTFAESVSISTEVLPNSTVTVGQYTDSALELIGKMYNNFTLIASTDMSVGSLPAHQVVYTITQGVYEFKILQVFAIVENEAYVITYTAESKNYAMYVGIADEMIQSFELI